MYVCVQLWKLPALIVDDFDEVTPNLLRSAYVEVCVCMNVCMCVYVCMYLELECNLIGMHVCAVDLLGTQFLYKVQIYDL